MTLKKFGLLVTAMIALFFLIPSQAEAKTWHYAVTPANSFSHKTFARAFMYGNYEYMKLYKSATTAKHQKTATGRVISNQKVFYARKTADKKVYEVIYQKKYYYMNTHDTHLYRYNTWRSGHKLVSTVKPNHPSQVMLKAKTHVYPSQYWLYNYGGRDTPLYDWYRLANSGHWIIDHAQH